MRRQRIHGDNIVSLLHGITSLPCSISRVQSLHYIIMTSQIHILRGPHLLYPAFFLRNDQHTLYTQRGECMQTVFVLAACTCSLGQNVFSNTLDLRDFGSFLCQVYSFTQWQLTFVDIILYSELVHQLTDSVSAERVGSPAGDIHVVAVVAVFRNALTGTGWSNSCLVCTNTIRKHYSHLVRSSNTTLTLKCPCMLPAGGHAHGGS